VVTYPVFPVWRLSLTHTLVYPITASHNAVGHLEIDGCDVVELAKTYDTPLLVYEEKSIRDQCRRYMGAFAEHTQDFEIIYASKAFSAVAIAELVLEEGLSLDVSSGGEYHVAKVAGFPPEKIFFHGNNKTREELDYASPAVWVS
jgi:diaminopimelate decarboxylase